jgi:hypothetical protein
MSPIKECENSSEIADLVWAHISTGPAMEELYLVITRHMEKLKAAGINDLRTTIHKTVELSWKAGFMNALENALCVQIPMPPEPPVAGAN